jgi:hypothetical protein
MRIVFYRTRTKELKGNVVTEKENENKKNYYFLFFKLFISYSRVKK